MFPVCSYIYIRPEKLARTSVFDIVDTKHQLAALPAAPGRARPAACSAGHGLHPPRGRLRVLRDFVVNFPRAEASSPPFETGRRSAPGPVRKVVSADSHRGYPTAAARWTIILRLAWGASLRIGTAAPTPSGRDPRIDHGARARLVRWTVIPRLAWGALLGIETADPLRTGRPKPPRRALPIRRQYPPPPPPASRPCRPGWRSTA
jgi:hypothetical protein